MNGLPQTQTLEKYNCEKCRFFTKDPNKYNIHIALHNEMRYVCANCNFESYTKAEFQRHLVSHTGKFPFTCAYCGYGAIRNDYIIKHIKRIHGDGKILCSVSTVENESKNASVNIVQTQVRASLQEPLPNNTTVLTKNGIDTTTGMEMAIVSSDHVHFNGSSSINDEQVEVEVISPTDQELKPWTTLTVVAPSSFKVSENCLAKVVEVKPIDGTCHLVLKLVDPNDEVSNKNLCEKSTSGSSESTKEGTPILDGSLLQKNTHLNGNENPLCALDTVPLTEELSGPSPTSPLNKMVDLNSPKGTSNDLTDETEELSDLPIISSVFSLSSEPTNGIEGIQWENNDVANTKVLDDGGAISSTSQGEPKVLETDANVLVKMDEQKLDLQSDLSENHDGEVKDDPKMELPFEKPALPCDQKPEDQAPDFAQISKRSERKSKRLSKEEASCKPQTLFLTCNKSIVMQPLSCLLESAQKTELPVEDDNATCKKTKPSKQKRKIDHKCFSAPRLKTLRLYPAKPDQLTPLPHKNQPVVVLNHPELESLETFFIMNTIARFRGNVLKVTLSKQTLKKFG